MPKEEEPFQKLPEEKDSEEISDISSQLREIFVGTSPDGGEDTELIEDESDVTRSQTADEVEIDTASAKSDEEKVIKAAGVNVKDNHEVSSTLADDRITEPESSKETPGNSAKVPIKRPALRQPTHRRILRANSSKKPSSRVVRERLIRFKEDGEKVHAKVPSLVRKRKGMSDVNEEAAADEIGNSKRRKPSNEEASPGEDKSTSDSQTMVAIALLSSIAVNSIKRFFNPE
ncbi:unnamed protein product [Kuraishia capsulata CBS 1993]|uniref:Uncharacterized protein n=1 Tax=Kuraishia capsulata CBS 1993 TaxID=1382522 RepID=W6MX62_9ASCO|nr:uncharacterized protein KUCA_T00004317001 [Kuraishia capsulata CBS 1993]CDK28335.1 unnamed protein product [Kuraishia capsulata CBS 1993]